MMFSRRSFLGTLISSCVAPYVITSKRVFQPISSFAWNLHGLPSDSAFFSSGLRQIPSSFRPYLYGDRYGLPRISLPDELMVESAGVVPSEVVFSRVGPWCRQMAIVDWWKSNPSYRYVGNIVNVSRGEIYDVRGRVL